MLKLGGFIGMGTIKININPEEKKKVLRAIRRKPRAATSVAKIANEAKLNPNRTRFVLDEMLEEGTVERKKTKSYNEKYIRYIYSIPKGG